MVICLPLCKKTKGLRANSMTPLVSHGIFVCSMNKFLWWIIQNKSDYWSHTMPALKDHNKVLKNVLIFRYNMKLLCDNTRNEFSSWLSRLWTLNVFSPEGPMTTVWVCVDFSLRFLVLTASAGRSWGRCRGAVVAWHTASSRCWIWPPECCDAHLLPPSDWLKSRPLRSPSDGWWSTEYTDKY